MSTIREPCTEFYVAIGGYRIPDVYYFLIDKYDYKYNY